MNRLRSRFFSSSTFPKPVRLQQKLFINNEFITSSITFPVVNPGNNEVITEVYGATPKEVSLAVEAAYNAFNSPKSKWRSEGTRFRAKCLYALADIIEKNKEELAVLESLNNGKTLQQSMTIDAPACANMLRYYAGWCDKITGKTIPLPYPQFFNFTHHEPVGVVGAIIPWNLPLIALAAKLGPALCTGNTIVLKSAEQTPLTALRVAEFIEEAGFPAGVVNIISGEGAISGKALVEHDLVDKISFTGSVEVGKYIQQAAAKTMKRTTMELGGKNPVVVCSDANISEAVDVIHNGVFWNKGEACAAAGRIFVHSSVYDEFVEKSKQKIMKRRVGNPFDGQSEQGAQVTEEHTQKIMKYIELGKKEGAKLLYGGQRLEINGCKGCYVQPTLFADVKDDMRIFKEEIFGPVMTINKFDEIEEVIPRANNSPYGLAAGIFTNIISTGSELQRRIKAGLMFWNCYHVVDVSAPFGGMKQSGFGREGGEYGLLPYLEVKNVVQRIK